MKNNDFEWTLDHVAAGVSLPPAFKDRLKRICFSPHDNIWPATSEAGFVSMCDRILQAVKELAPDHRRQFLSVCLASYLLNPEKAPASFGEWLLDKISPEAVVGIDLTWTEICTLRWRRAAIPAVDLVNGQDDRIIYALVGCGNNAGPLLRIPDWAKEKLNREALKSVEIATQLLASRRRSFIFWPMLDSINESISLKGNSLGLPVYLSFKSVADDVPIPPILATGSLDENGALHEVGSLPKKLQLAYDTGFTGFIYPQSQRMPAFDSSIPIEPKAVKTLAEAEATWSGLIRLQNALMPISFKQDIEVYSNGFTGREWLIKEIDAWAADQDGGKIYWLTGEPGIGKTALSAWFAANSDYVAACHFCDYRSEEKRDPAKLVCSIAYQFASFLPEYASRLNSHPFEKYLQEYSEVYTLFEKLIVLPLSEDIAPPARPIVVVIDALDETSNNSRNEIAILLSQHAHKTPPWLRFFVTSRPEPEITSPFYGVISHKIESSADENHEDIAAYLTKRIDGITVQQTRAILEQSEGSFLYARYVCNEIIAGTLNLDRIDAFPRGLNGVYHDFFDRLSGKDATPFRRRYSPILRLLMAAREPLRIGLLRQILEIEDREELFEQLDHLGSLFPRTGDDGDATITPWHGSVRDWLTIRERSGPYWIDVVQGHKLLAEYGWQRFQQGADDLPPYFLGWLTFHLMQCERKDYAVKVLKDFNVMMLRAGWKQARDYYLERMLADYREIRHEAISIEAAFFRENAHILRRGDEQWPAYKILLQLAVEHADDSPLSLVAEEFLKENKCNWPWLRRELRPKKIQFTGCLAVMEHDDKVNGALLLKDNRILSWSDDHTLRIWDDNGTLMHILQGHTEKIVGTTILSDDTIVSWSKNELYYWDQSGNCEYSIKEFQTKLLLIFDDGRLLVQFNVLGDLLLFSGNKKTIIDTDDDLIIGVLPLSDGGFITQPISGPNLRFYDKYGNFVKSVNIFGEDDIDTEKNTITRDHIKLLKDGRIVSWTSRGDLYLWNQDGLPITQLQAMDEWADDYISIDSIAELSNGSILVSFERPLSYNHTLLLWNKDGSTRVWKDTHFSCLSFFCSEKVVL